MALFGTLSTLHRTLKHLPAFAVAWQHAVDAVRPGSTLHDRILGLKLDVTERIDLSGGLFSLIQAYETKPSTDVRWESHLQYVDLQFVITGEECMEVCDTAWLAVGENLTPAKDVIFYQPYAPASRLYVRPGEAAVFFPVDAHRPSLAVEGPRLVRKVVVKIPVEGMT